MTTEQLEIPAREVRENESETVAVMPLIRLASEPPSDPTPEQQMRLIEISGSLDFWDRPEEDVYTPEDGEPI